MQASFLKLNLPRFGAKQTASLSRYPRWKSPTVVNLHPVNALLLLAIGQQSITPYTHAGLRFQQTYYVKIHTPCLGWRLKKTKAYQAKLQSFPCTNYTINFSISPIIQLFQIFTTFTYMSHFVVPLIATWLSACSSFYVAGHWSKSICS
jgi:hypothetical protein